MALLIEASIKLVGLTAMKVKFVHRIKKILFIAKLSWFDKGKRYWFFAYARLNRKSMKYNKSA